MRNFILDDWLGILGFAFMGDKILSCDVNMKNKDSH
jgi:hypothetical protein